MIVTMFVTIEVSVDTLEEAVIVFVLNVDDSTSTI
jgi:hypothetical protein